MHIHVTVKAYNQGIYKCTGNSKNGIQVHVTIII